MTPGYGDTFTVWCSPTPGTTVWTFQFKDGFISRRYVKVRYCDILGEWHERPIDPLKNFIDDGTLRIDGPPIPPCMMVDIYRDTPKDHPIVVYKPGGNPITEEARNIAGRQSMHVVAELVNLAYRQDLPCLCECVEAGQ